MFGLYFQVNIVCIYVPTMIPYFVNIIESGVKHHNPRTLWLLRR